MIDYMLCREQRNPQKVVLFADSHDTLFHPIACPSAEQYAQAYWNHGADLIFQADGVKPLPILQGMFGVDLWWQSSRSRNLQSELVPSFILSLLQGCGWASDEMCKEYRKTKQTKPFLNSGVILASVESLRSMLEAHLRDTPDHDQA